MKETFMSKGSNSNQNSDISDEQEMLDEYDFSKGLRGNKYFERYRSLQGKIPVKITSENGNRSVHLITVDTEAMITSDGQLIAQVPSDFTPGLHRVTLIIEEPRNLPTEEASSEIYKSNQNCLNFS